MAYWRGRLAGVPDTAPAAAGHAPADPPVQRWTLRSAALAAASVEVGARTRTSSSTVLLTLAATALAAVRGEDTVAVQLIAGNRYTDRQQQLVAAAAQDALLVFRRSDTSLDEAVRGVYREATEAYFHGQYDPRSLEATLAGVARARSHPVDLSGYFNDARGGRDWDLPGSPGAADEAEPVLTQGFARHDMTFCLSLVQRGAACEISLLADTARIPEQRIPLFLTGLGALLREAAVRDVGLAEVPAALGITAGIRTDPAPVAKTGRGPDPAPVPETAHAAETAPAAAPAPDGPGHSPSDDRSTR
jgi:hypothetical protein